MLPFTLSLMDPVATAPGSVPPESTNGYFEREGSICFLIFWPHGNLVVAGLRQHAGPIFDGLRACKQIHPRRPNSEYRILFRRGQMQYHGLPFLRSPKISNRIHSD